MQTFSFSVSNLSKWARNIFELKLIVLVALHIAIYSCLLQHSALSIPFRAVCMYQYLTSHMYTYSYCTQVSYTNNFPGCFHDLLNDLGSAKPKKKYLVTLCPLVHTSRSTPVAIRQWPHCIS